MATEDRNFKQYLRKRDWLWLAILFLFAAEAIWLAIHSNYPMAFDEGYHFGLIQFFSTHWSPFVTSQPASSYNLGAIVHDSSFLYHYLLSFPYRIIAHFTSSLFIQVVSLRLLNVAMAVGSLVLIKKIVRELGVSSKLANIIVLVFAFTPMFSVLSAQINYDNLVILAASGSILMALRFVGRLQAGRFDSWLFAMQWSVCLLACLVKFEFLPICIGLGLAEAWYVVRFWRSHGTDKLWHTLHTSLGQLSRRQKSIMVLASIVSVSLFGIFYGYNLAVYKSPAPQCNQILSIADCTHYYAWDRNYNLSLVRSSAPPLMNALHYSVFWGKQEFYQLFAEIVPTGGIVPVDHAFYLSLILLTAAAAICTISQLPTILRKHRLLPLTLVVVVAYLATLWSRNYHDYVNLGQPVAIQGRYVLPVLLYIYIVLALGVYYSFTRERQLFSMGRLVLGTAIVSVFLYFGGFNRYITQISPYTAWPTAVKNVSLQTASQTK